VYQRERGGGCLLECSYIKLHSDSGGQRVEDAVMLLFRPYTLCYSNTVV
jgi:hypothetical protein